MDDYELRKAFFVKEFVRLFASCFPDGDLVAVHVTRSGHSGVYRYRSNAFYYYGDSYIKATCYSDSLSKDVAENLCDCAVWALQRPHPDDWTISTCSRIWSDGFEDGSTGKLEVVKGFSR